MRLHTGRMNGGGKGGGGRVLILVEEGNQGGGGGKSPKRSLGGKKSCVYCQERIKGKKGPDHLFGTELEKEGKKRSRDLKGRGGSHQWSQRWLNTSGGGKKKCSYIEEGRFICLQGGKIGMIHHPEQGRRRKGHKKREKFFASYLRNQREKKAHGPWFMCKEGKGGGGIRLMHLPASREKKKKDEE